MDIAVVIVLALCFLIAGIALGGFYFRLHFRSKNSENTHRLRADFEQKLAVLNERLSAKEAGLSAASAEITTLKGESAALQNTLTALKMDRASLEARLEKEQKAAAEKLAILNEAKSNLSDAFKALSADALKSNNQTFLEVAKSTFEKLKQGADQDLLKRQAAIDQVVKPVKEGLEKFDHQIQALEKARVGAYEGLNQQVKSLIDSQVQLRSETSNLVNALRTPQVRGRWGEIQLKRVVEIAGMLSHCDFKEQQVLNAEAGQLRPDMVVNLPGGKTIVVDAKVPLSAYLDGMEANDEVVMQAKRKEHARRIREHISELSRKAYWEQFSQAPEFVVLFLAGEAFFSAALQEDPALIESGVDQRVIIATPTTLIALLKAVAYGWQQEDLAENSKKIGALGKELYKRVVDMGGHFTQLGGNLKKAVESYNKTLGTFESRVLVSARRFEELKIADAKKSIHPLSPIDSVTRVLQAPELAAIEDAEKIENAEKSEDQNP